MADRETTDLSHLLHLLSVRVLVLAAVTALVGYTTVAMALGLIGCGLLFAPVRPKQVRPEDAPATLEPPGSPAPDRGPRGG